MVRIINLRRLALDQQLALMTSVISVTSIPNKGRGYIAQRDIKAGEIILEEDRKSTRLNSSHSGESRMPSSA